MNRTGILVIVAALVVGAAAGYWLGGGEKETPAAMTPTATDGGQGRILYYRNPMGLADTSPVPKKDNMGMDYIPVYERDAANAGNGIVISPEKIQRTGVRTEVAARRSLTRSVEAVGKIMFDDRRMAVVAPRFEGWIERLHVAATATPVTAGQPLMDVYSPEVVQIEQEYALARQAPPVAPGLMGTNADAIGSLTAAALQRLANLGVPESELRRLQSQGTPRQQLTLVSPRAGIVVTKNAVLGQHFAHGEQLYHIVDTSAVWMVAQVFEQDLSAISEGDEVRLTVKALEGHEFRGTVSYIAPQLDRDTRTADVRIDLPNPDGLLKAEMYATAVFTGAQAATPVLAVPDSAVIDSGRQRVVLVSKGQGRFEPRVVRVGMRADGFSEIVEGLMEGEQVVVNATFLVDAESNLQSALRGFSQPPAPPAKPAP